MSVVQEDAEGRRSDGDFQARNEPVRKERMVGYFCEILERLDVH